MGGPQLETSKPSVASENMVNSLLVLVTLIRRVGKGWASQCRQCSSSRISLWAAVNLVQLTVLSIAEEGYFGPVTWPRHHASPGP